mmetsp:Transcript_10534/g.21228  ORF Transcript_10534/g.21228 Transcript_10534/m.21228 type:complete len:102 (-) Transcript_10534:260-565(-)
MSPGPIVRREKHGDRTSGEDGSSRTRWLGQAFSEVQDQENILWIVSKYGRVDEASRWKIPQIHTPTWKAENTRGVGSNSKLFYSPITWLGRAMRGLSAFRR